jgi:hypothetical protein
MSDINQVDFSLAQFDDFEYPLLVFWRIADFFQFVVELEEEMI